ncbi:hypothetical protein HJC23_001356 [Cyclotella cryptica]|uniref:Uncharacterized protein n=1 Tax=Cyclotella cryptica TaxID=29204 RepID=A0ABD3PN05_9STRA|eukprot:CCRYP_013125-RA/>CCRYP_013125-RA protein AED:0.05 eAED:-0.04 QI:0/-1/0/1/-1/1/1/0/462
MPSMVYATLPHADNGVAMQQQQSRNHIKPDDRRYRLGVKVNFIFMLMLIFICELLFVKPRFLREQSTLSLKQNMVNSNPTQRWTTPIATVTHNQATTPNSPYAIANVSTTPLFYHISPGSTGSRSLYHAACHAGFPSIHHKSFCIASSRGIATVAREVVVGVRAHYELLRLYSLAGECCKLWNKGGLEEPIHDDDDAVEEKALLSPLCFTPLDEWADQVRHHLRTVMQSGLVGLFDTPYPYLAPQVLDLAKQWRTSTILAMTERDPTSWAKSRIKHGLLLCREEYSYKRLGSSEFDVLGCITRAYQWNNLTISTNHESKPPNVATLHFWDVFRYRSHHEEIDSEFQIGLEHQMEHHQTIYLPLARYTPNFFGVTHNKSTTDKQNTAQHHHINEKDVSRDIRHHVLSAKKSSSRHDYNVSLKCRGRVNWDMKHDAFIELYHLPKTCDFMEGTEMIPLMSFGFH